jgi:hypothetical protein
MYKVGKVLMFFSRLRRIKTALQRTMLSDKYEEWLKLQTRERARENAKIVKSDTYTH